MWRYRVSPSQLLYVTSASCPYIIAQVILSTGLDLILLTAGLSGDCVVLCDVMAHSSQLCRCRLVLACVVLACCSLK